MIFRQRDWKSEFSVLLKQHNYYSSERRSVGLLLRRRRRRRKPLRLLRNSDPSRSPSTKRQHTSAKLPTIYSNFFPAITRIENYTTGECRREIACTPNRLPTPGVCRLNKYNEIVMQRRSCLNCSHF